MKLEKLILGTFAAFVETGTTFGTSPVNTVSAALFPDTTTHAAVWSSLGDVLDSSLDPKTEDYSDTVPDPAGGYRTVSDPVVLQDNIKLSLLSHSEPIHRMVWGVNGEIVDGTPVTPFAAKRRHVEGWLNFTLRGQDGADRVVAALYGRMRIDGAPKWAKDPTKPAIVFEVMRSTVASIVPDNVTA